MVNFNIGSIADLVGGFIGWSNLNSISGTTLNGLISQEINYVENYTTQTITDTNIPESYQPAILDLTLSKVLISLDAQSGGINTVRLGDLSIGASTSSSSQIAKQLRIDAIERLKELQRTLRFKRVLGASY